MTVSGRDNAACLSQLHNNLVTGSQMCEETAGPSDICNQPTMLGTDTAVTEYSDLLSANSAANNVVLEVRGGYETHLASSSSAKSETSLSVSN